jgi:ring-1,2-phenylacetyl-CoA epoxidase subunit PaaE
MPSNVSEISMSRFRSLTVKDIRRETKDSVSVSFAVPDALKANFAFQPGQYLTLRSNINGEDIRRSYSICSGIDDADLRVGIKKVRGGAFSNYANDHLKVGETIDVMPPSGRFTPSAHAGKHHILGIASGSGITPILSIIRSLLVRESEARITLIYGNQTSSSVMFAEEIEDLKNQHLGRLSVVHILSRESQDIDLLSGRITAAKLNQLATGAIDFTSVTEAFLCGPEGMVNEATAALTSLGLSAEKIRFELFTPAKRRKHHEAIPSAKMSDEILSRITIVLDGKRHAFDFLASDESLIEAAERYGLELPYSCKGGMCCTCRCKVEKGEAEMSINYSLEDWEMQAGFVLGCQARPKTPDLTLDFDHL